MNIKLINNSIKKEILTKDDLFNFLDHSYNTIKTIKGFDIFIKENAKFENGKYVINKKYLLDYKAYCNLFITYNNEEEILYYVQDNCEARGETIPKDFNKAMNYLKNDNVIVWEILEFTIEKEIIDSLLNENIQKIISI